MKRILSVLWNIFKVLRANHDKEVVIRLSPETPPYIDVDWENFIMREDDDLLLIVTRTKPVKFRSFLDPEV